MQATTIFVHTNCWNRCWTPTYQSQNSRNQIWMVTWKNYSHQGWQNWTKHWW
jgi:hypothetical protein